MVLALSSSFWGLSWIPLQYFEQHGVAGTAIIFITHLVLLVLVTPFGWRQALRREQRLSVLGIALAGGMGIFTFTYAFIYGDVVRVMVLFYLLPIWGVLGGRVFLKEPLDLIRWCGVVIAVIGAFLILGGMRILEAPPSWIDALALLSGFCFAMNNILFRGITGLPLPSKLWVMFIGVIVLTGSVLLLGLEPGPKVADGATWLWLFLYAAIALLLANLGSQWAIERMEAGKSSIIITMQLVAAVGSATLVGGDVLTVSEWLGCAMVISAAVLEASRERPISNRSLVPQN